MPRDGDAARRRLQAAAFALFEARGYAAVTTAEIAAEAGVTERTFFRHFPDKREVLFAGEADFLGALVQGVARAPKPLGALDALLFGFCEIAPTMESYRPYSLARQTLIEGAPALRERELAKGAAMIAALAKALEARGVEAGAAALAAHAGFAAFQHAAKAWAQGTQGDFADHLRQAFKKLQALAAGAAN